MIRYKEVCFHLDEVAHKLERVSEEFCCGLDSFDYDTEYQYYRFKCLADSLLYHKLIDKKFMKKKKLVRRDLVYFKLFLTEEDKLIYKANCPKFANKIINKIQEPVPQELQRPVYRHNDFTITDHFYLNDQYIFPYLVQIDQNSAEPYIISKLFPSISSDIQNLYNERVSCTDEIKKSIIKKTLVCLGGQLSIYSPVYYEAMCDILWDGLNSLMTQYEDYGIIPFATRRDAILFRCETKEDVEFIKQTLSIGNELGQWKMKVDENVLVQTLNFEHTYKLYGAKNISSKLSGQKQRLNISDVVDWIGSTRTKKGVEINEEIYQRVKNGDREIICE